MKQTPDDGHLVLTLVLLENSWAFNSVSYCVLASIYSSSHLDTQDTVLNVVGVNLGLHVSLKNASSFFCFYI